MKNNNKVTSSSKILAFMLAVILILSMIPINMIVAMADSGSHTNVFTVTVNDGSSQPISDASITFTETATTGGGMQFTVTTGNDGVAMVPDISALSSTSTDAEFDYTASAVGFSDETGKIRVNTSLDNYEGNIDVNMMTPLSMVSLTGTVTDSVSGQPVSGANVSVSGYATFSPVTTATDGTYSVQVFDGKAYSISVTDSLYATGTTALDLATDSATADFSLVKDAVKPLVVSASASETKWTNGGITISGTVSDDFSGIDKIYYKIGDAGAPQEITNNSGSFSFTVGAQNYDGDYIIYCTDKAGNQSTDKTVTIKMDSTLPTVGSVNADVTNWTNGDIVISGTVSDNLSGINKIYYKKGAAGTPTEVVNLSGSYSFTVNAQDYDGDYIIYCTDNAGNQSTDSTVAVKMDNQKCVVLTSSADNTNWTSGNITISGTVSDNLSGINKIYYKKGTAGAPTEVANNSGSYSFTVSAQNYDGDYIIYCTDNAGNQSVDSTVTVKMDNTKPVVATANADITNWSNGNVTISGTVSDNLSGINKIYYKKGTAGTPTEITNSSGAYTFTVNAQNYNGDYIVYCTDNAGNQSIDSTVTVKMDNAKPVVDSAMANPNSWTNSNVVISGTVSDNLSGINKIYYKKGTAGTPTEITNSSGAYTFTVNAQNYNGDYIVYCTDNAGNQSVDSTVTVKMDTTIPVVNTAIADITNWTNGNITISGTVSDNLSGINKIYYKKGAAGTPTEVTNNSGSYSFTINAQNYDGDYIIYCTDKAGNQSIDSTIAVKMDNTRCIVLTCSANNTNWTNGNVVISGTVSDNLSGINKIYYKRGTAGAPTEVANNSGSYSFTVNAQDYSGDYIVYCIDNAGNQSIDSTVTVKMDNTKPVVDSATANPNSWTNSNVVISGTVSDNLSGINKIYYKKGTAGASTEIANNSGAYTFTVNAQNYEGDYIVYSTDNTGNQSDDKTVAVKMDITAPSQPVITYSTSVLDTILNTITFGFYNAPVTVTIASDDAASGVNTFAYTYGNNASDISPALGQSDVSSTLTSLIKSGNTYTGTFTISPQFRGLVKATATDFGGNNSSQTTGTKIIVDNIAPNATVSYNAASRTTSAMNYYNPTATNIDFYNGDVTATITIDEANFDPSQVLISIGKTGTDSDYTSTNGWSHTPETNKWTRSITLSADGDYKIAIQYTDYSTNKMTDYTKGNITIDKIAPTIAVAYDNNSVINGQYFAANRIATVTIVEHNFNASEVALTITAKDSTGSDVTPLPTFSAWSTNGDTHTATISYLADANYTFASSYIDLATNSNSAVDYTGQIASNTFTVDKTAPTNLQVVYKDDNKVLDDILGVISFGFYKGQMTVEISADDATAGVNDFKYSYVKSQGVSDVNAELLNAAISSANIAYSNGNKTATASFTIPKEALNGENQFRGTVEFTANDKSNNSTDQKESKQIIVDNISPTMKVEYSAPVQTVNGISYYSTDAKATFTITEANFFKEDVDIKVTKDTGVAEGRIPADWTQSGDTWTGSITLSGDGDYVISVDYKDRSNNQMATYTSNQLTVDMTDPTITVSGIKSDSANKGDKIGFTLTSHDKNFDVKEFKPTLTAVFRKDDGQFETKDVSLGIVKTNIDGQEYSYTIDNLDTDGIYTLSCSEMDLSHRTVSTMVIADSNSAKMQNLAFSVNRKGSTYDPSAETKAVLNKYIGQPIDIAVSEINPDPLTETKITLFKDNETKILAKDVDYTITDTHGNGSWSRYTYTINKKNFEVDGNYSVAIYSVDKAGSVSQNDMETKKVELNFGKDATAPTITVVDLEDGITYPIASKEVAMKVNDNFVLSSISVELDGKQIKTWSKDEISGIIKSGSDFTFVIPGDSTSAHNLKVVALDMAGNGDKTPKEIKNFYVTTNIFVRYYNNKALFFGSIGGVILLLGALTFIMFKRRKKTV